MLKKLFASAFVTFAIATSGSALHPFGQVRKEKSSGSLLEGGEIDGATLSILERACQNCHSERTYWPWYSHVAPASWLVERDIRQARAYLNLSRWKYYSEDQREALLSAIGAAARTRVMPPGRYTLLHPEARLSGVEREQVYKWTRRERRRLKPDRAIRIASEVPVRRKQRK